MHDHKLNSGPLCADHSYNNNGALSRILLLKYGSNMCDPCRASCLMHVMPHAQHKWSMHHPELHPCPELAHDRYDNNSTLALDSKTLNWLHDRYPICIFLLHCATIHPYATLPMPKIRDSKSKSDLLEVAITQTRRGKRITHVPVQDLQESPGPSRSTSPLKKRAWSPGVPELNNDDSEMNKLPKRSRTVRKVSPTVDGTSL